MKDTILYELEYDKDGNPDIRVTMKTTKRNMTFRLSECEIPNFEDLPINIQLETLSRLVVTVVKDVDAEVNAIEMSERNSKNKRKFEPEVMEVYLSIVEECNKNKKSAKYWEDAHEECAKYSKKNHSDPIYIKISRMGLKAFKKMIGHYKMVRNPDLPKTSRSS